MRPDHYAALEVEPSASAAEIRAAYVKLLREHHPDRNRSPEAVDRTKTIIAAFKVLGDFDQRSHYDWDRRRDREASQAKAEAEAPRRRKTAGFAAGGIGLAAVGAWLLMPGANPEQPEAVPKTAAVEPQRQTAPAQTAAARPATERREQRVMEMRTRPKLAKAPQTKSPERVASSDPPKSVPARAAAKPVERVALKSVPPRAVKAIAPRRADAVAAQTRVASKPAPPVRVAAKPATVDRVAAKSPPTAPRPRQSTARPATDLASLDQFVMNFYGQSWRFGDAPKRSALEQTRAGFVVRRGACVAEACKRAAYLKLMRDVSEIVETGKPQKP